MNEKSSEKQRCGLLFKAPTLIPNKNYFYSIIWAKNKLVCCFRCIPFSHVRSSIATKKITEHNNIVEVECERKTACLATLLKRSNQGRNAYMQFAVLMIRVIANLHSIAKLLECQENADGATEEKKVSNWLKSFFIRCSWNDGPHEIKKFSTDFFLSLWKWMRVTGIESVEGVEKGESMQSC